MIQVERALYDFLKLVCRNLDQILVQCNCWYAERHFDRSLSFADAVCTQLKFVEDELCMMFSIPVVERQRVPLAGNPVRRTDPIYSLHLHRTLIQPASSDQENGTRAPRQASHATGTIAASPVNAARPDQGVAPKEELGAERVVEFYVGPATGSQLKLWTESHPVADVAAELEPVTEGGRSRAGF